MTSLYVLEYQQDDGSWKPAETEAASGGWYMISLTRERWKYVMAKRKKEYPDVEMRIAEYTRREPK